MFVVGLLLFSALLYNIEALPAENGRDDYWNQTTNATVSDTSKGKNGSESFAVENNYSVPVPYGGEIPINSTGDDDKTNNYTESRDPHSVTTQHTRYKPTDEVSETTTKKISYDSYWTTPNFWYFDPPTTTDRPYNGYWDRVYPGALTTARPYNGYWGRRHSETPTTDRPYNGYWGRRDSEISTTDIPYNGYWGRRDSETSTTDRPYNGYWGRRDSETSTTDRPYNGYWGRRDSETSTTTRPYNGYWGRRNSETSTTDRPYNGYWGRIDSAASTTARPYNGYPGWGLSAITTTTEAAPTPTLPIEWILFKYDVTSTTYKNTWAPTSTTDTYKSTPRNFVCAQHPTTTTDTYKYTSDPTSTTNTYNTVKSTEQANPTTPASPCKSCNPLSISINSTINTNDTGNYGTFIDWLKKIAGNKPSNINIAPNLNVPNLAIAPGNGNMFFYISN